MKTIQNIIDEIQTILIKSNVQKIGLHDGSAGYLLFHAFSNQENNLEYIGEEINKCQLFLNNSSNFKDIDSYTLCKGICGYGWVLEFLAENQFIEYSDIEFLDHLDTKLYKIIEKENKIENLDFLHGTIGMGIYFLKRLRKNSSILYLNQILNSLDYYSKRDKDGSIYWISILDKNEKGINFGLAHGLPSILSFLCLLYKNNINSKLSLSLINGIITFIMKYKHDPSKYGSFFPTYISNNSGVSKSSRLAWCYGDLGVAISLWNCGKIINDEKLKRMGVDILIKCSDRKDVVNEHVIDAGICHGTSGIAQIYNRMHRNTGIVKFKESYDFWINETIKMAKFEDGFARFKTYHGEEYGGWKNEYGLLEGITGIGLTLISAIIDIEPKWDECLLLS